MLEQGERFGKDIESLMLLKMRLTMERDRVE